MPSSAIFFTASSPCDALTAARSETQSTPVVSFTNAEPENVPGTAFNSFAEYVKNGSPFAPANARSAGSSFLRSMLAMQESSEAETPCAESSRRTNASNASGSFPRRQPAPSAKRCGISQSVVSYGVLCSRETQTPIFAFPVVSPAGSVPETGRSDENPTGSPLRSAAETCFASSMFVMNRRFCFANTSTANNSLMSVAVVITGVAPSAFESVSASAFDPPRCPESSGIANVPFSSSTSTAGSVFLSLTHGAIARTAMPLAQTKISASARAKPSPAHCAAEPSSGSSPAFRNFGSAKRRQSCPACSSASATRSAVSRPCAV